jgi:hypothetical protein
MVRLRSNRWYAADGQRNRQRSVALKVAGTRRVLSLCLLLAMVIVLMQQAADPRHVRHAFQALGVPLDATAVATTPAATEDRPGSDWLAANLPADSSSASREASHAWQATCSDVIPRILDSWTTDQQRALSLAWFARIESTDARDVPPHVAADDNTADDNTADDNTADSDTSDGALQSSLALPSECLQVSLEVIESLTEQTLQSPMPPDDKTRWLEQLQRFSSQWQKLCNTPSSSDLPAEVSPELQQALTAALDQRLVASLRDAAPWTQTETLAFWRLLQRTSSNATIPASSFSAATAPLYSTLQLDAEAHSLRGQPLRFRGSVRRVQRVEREFAPLNMRDGYWIVWLRGEDEALQPVAVYTTDPQASELAAQVENRDVDYPPVEVHAIFAKRLAYASATGLQVGPALFASQLVPLSGPAPPLPPLTTGQLGGRFGIAVVAACLLAIAIVLPILWGSRQRVARNARADRWLLLLATAAGMPVWLTAPSQLAHGASPAQATDVATPPWVQPALDPLTEFLTIGGQLPLTKAAADELRATLQNHSSPFPNTLLKLINAARRVGWPQPHLAGERVASQSLELGEGLQLQVQTVAGWVRAATPVVLDETQQAWFQADEQTRLYQVELQLQTAETVTGATQARADAAPLNRPAAELLTLYCERVPQAWLASAQLRQPATFTTLTLVEQTAAGDSALCALAAAPQWLLPRDMSSAQLEAQLAPPLAPYVLQLGRLGWDLTYLDTIAAKNQLPLSRDEAPGFYSLLRLSSPADQAMTNTFSGAGDVPANQPLALLADARGSVCKPVQWRVRIVTGTLVQVDNPVDQQQLGAQAYVQYDGFVDIGNDRIQFQPVGGSEAIPKLDFSGEFPVTIVATLGGPFASSDRLADGQQSWSVGKYALLQGRFYRLWSYQSELLKSSSAQARQIAPLIVASNLIPTTPPVRVDPSNVGWFGWALCGAMLFILATILWLSSRKKRVLPA